MGEKLEQVKNYFITEEFSKRECALTLGVAFLSGLVLGMIISPRKRVENNTYKCYYEEEE